MTRTHPEPRLPDNMNGTDQALHASSTPPSGHRSPATDDAPRDRQMASDQDPHKIPTPHPAHRPYQHHADITATPRSA